MRRVVLDEPIETAGPAPGADAGEALGRAMLAPLGAATEDDGRVDYARLARSDAFAAAEGAARGVVRLGARRRVLEVWNFFGRVAYRVGAHTLSADDIEHGVLRGNRRRVAPPLRPFSRRDARLALVVEGGDPRIHFALSCGARACPAVGVYGAACVDAQLDQATRSYVNQEVRFVGPFLLRYLDEGPACAAIAAGAAPCAAFRRYEWALPHPPVER